MWHTEGHSSDGVNIAPHRDAKSGEMRMSYGVVTNRFGNQIVEGGDCFVRSGWRSDAAVVDLATVGKFCGQPCSAVDDLDANRVVALGDVPRQWIRHEISLQMVSRCLEQSLSSARVSTVARMLSIYGMASLLARADTRKHIIGEDVH